ncbi:MAG TPA: cupin domain-containing protein [Solirubrobacteraceae bacterium]|jgi:mannose-6-phosphate isomerase-like protein (cupin superfamily)|nr:cupin domain-containing protein [Solirubrobacteraceae bacterium]
MRIAHRDALDAFVTIDGSEIRELARMDNSTLAEARVAPATETYAHFHSFEEIYYFTAGRGRMRLGDEVADVRPGDCVRIPPGAAHKLWADPDEPLVLLCSCAPAFSDEGTTMLEGPSAPGP